MSHYADRDIEGDLRVHYMRHLHAMTAEGLHQKSAIAAELAWRDGEIERLTAMIDTLPKTADGIPIYPAMTVYTWEYRTLAGALIEAQVWSTSIAGKKIHICGCGLSVTDFLKPSALFSTREAAESAKEPS